MQIVFLILCYFHIFDDRKKIFRFILYFKAESLDIVGRKRRKLNDLSNEQNRATLVSATLRHLSFFYVDTFFSMCVVRRRKI